MSFDSLTMPWPAAAAGRLPRGGPAPRRGSIRAGGDAWGRRLPQPWRGSRRVHAPSDDAAPHTFVPDEALPSSAAVPPLQPRPYPRPSQNRV